MERKNYSYDDYGDSLIVSNRQENEIVKNNFEVGNIIFSLTGKGKIVSVEIREFSSFLEFCNLNSNIANSISNIEFIVTPKKDTIFLILKISFLENGLEISKNIPLIMPLINQ
jgi:hypothetical protein